MTTTRRYFCHYCGKSVTSELPEDAVIRATIICPECLAGGDPAMVEAALISIAAAAQRREDKQ